jgi:hypothetical protein
MSLDEEQTGDESRLSADMWQPIETAPTDGTKILGWCGSFCDICYRDRKFGNDVWMTDGCADFGGSENPTHWMPMPEAPTTTACIATSQHTRSEPPESDRRTGPPDRRLAGHGLLWLGFEVERSSAPGRRSTDRYFRQEPQPPADRCT